MRSARGERGERGERGVRGVREVRGVRGESTVGRAHLGHISAGAEGQDRLSPPKPIDERIDDCLAVAHDGPHKHAAGRGEVMVMIEGWSERCGRV